MFNRLLKHIFFPALVVVVMEKLFYHSGDPRCQELLVRIYRNEAVANKLSYVRIDNWKRMSGKITVWIEERQEYVVVPDAMLGVPALFFGAGRPPLHGLKSITDYFGLGPLASAVDQVAAGGPSPSSSSSSSSSSAAAPLFVTSGAAAAAAAPPEQPKDPNAPTFLAPTVIVAGNRQPSAFVPSAPAHSSARPF